MKICMKCEQEKPYDNFESYLLKTGNFSYRKKCKDCRQYEKNLTDSRSPVSTRRSRLRKYGLSTKQYLDMVDMQNNKCAICLKNNDSGPWTDMLVVDHCHKTNKVRQLLCDKCNRGLGQFKDNPELLMTAANYLIRHQG